MGFTQGAHGGSDFLVMLNTSQLRGQGLAFGLPFDVRWLARLIGGPVFGLEFFDQRRLELDIKKLGLRTVHALAGRKSRAK
jgi:hypothetical protein